MRSPSIRRAILACLILVLAVWHFRFHTSVATAKENPVRNVRWVGEVRVGTDGFYRVSADKLAALGLGPATTMRVTRRGIDVPSRAVKGDLVFLALATEGPHSRLATFRIEAATADAKRDHPTKKSAQAVNPSRVLRRVYAPDHYLGALASADPRVYGGQPPVWFAMGLEAFGEGSMLLGAMGAAAGSDQTLRLHVFSTHLGPVKLRATWNEVDLGLATAPRANRGAVLEWKIPARAVPRMRESIRLTDATATLPPRAAGDLSPGYGWLWIDAFHLVGPMGTIKEQLANQPFARLPVTSGETIPAPNGVAFLLSRESNSLTPPVWSKKDGGYVLGDVPADTVLYAQSTITETAVRKLALRPEDKPLVPAGTEHVIVSVPQLVDAVKPLVVHRTRTGTPSVVVSIADVYSRFGYGERTPEALRAFMIHLMKRDDMALKYVMLLGDAVYDRTDLAKIWTIPTLMARTMYNGATASDRLYTRPPSKDTHSGGPALGRLPFRTPEAVSAFVKRLIAYETAPPAHSSRRMMRFVTSEGRFGPLVDMLLEGAFRRVVADGIPPAYDVEVTFANPRSAFLWPPPEFNQKVIDGINDGALFYTYVGHGFAEGFDQLQAGSARFPILTVQHAPAIDIRGTSPIVLVLACTTAQFDRKQRRGDGIGEALMKRPKGPIAYWGATRICHPAANTLIARAMTRFLHHRAGTLRLGDVIRKAMDESIAPTVPDPGRSAIRFGIKLMVKGVSPERLVREASEMFILLGDPATRIAFPKNDIRVSATRGKKPTTLNVFAETDLPDGTPVALSVEFPRTANAYKPKPVANVLDPDAFPTIRENHRRMNDWAIARVTGNVKHGKVAAEMTLSAAEGWEGFLVKAVAITQGDVHHGAYVIPPRSTKEK